MEGFNLPAKQARDLARGKTETSQATQAVSAICLVIELLAERRAVESMVLQNCMTSRMSDSLYWGADATVRAEVRRRLRRLGYKVGRECAFTDRSVRFLRISWIEEN